MDTSPPNYNPNASLLNGGTEASIMKVMGGGGGSDLNGYNETQSLLNGGLDAVIEKIEGGADADAAASAAAAVATTLSNKEFADYKLVQTDVKDQREFEALKKVILSSTSLSAITTRLATFVLNKSKAIFRYINKGDGILERTSLENSDDKQIIKYIPSTAKYVAVVPEIIDPYDFFIFIKFLIVGDLCSIDRANNYVLKKDVYIIFLNLVFENNNQEILKYMYYKFKSTNINQCILITETEKAILFIDNKNVGFLSSDTDKFFKPQGEDTLDITEKDLIDTYGIRALKYNKSDDIYDNIQVIKPGNVNTENASDYNIELNDKVLLFKLKEFDVVYQTIDLYGKKYKIRVPRFRDQSDSIYKAWTDINYNKDETELINDLNLNMLFDDTQNEIPKFLYYLSYYKCFDDVSLLTRQECKEMRTILETIYKKIIENREQS